VHWCSAARIYNQWNGSIRREVLFTGHTVTVADMASCIMRGAPTCGAGKTAPPAFVRCSAPAVSVNGVHQRCLKVSASAAVLTAKPSSSFPTTSDKYAIIDVGGVQHLVEEGRWYTCNRLKAEPGDVVSFGRVLALKADDEFHVGRPYVEGVTVEAEIIEELKGPKVTIYKMQPKKHTRKTVGHRQPLSKCALDGKSRVV
jgi:large subunit ribosomal protein L21